ncbi:reverse transcriptase domain-containing protein [Tanacetum coccineum]
MIWLRAETPSTSHPLPLPTSSPPLQLLPSDHRTDRPEITLPPRKGMGVDLGPRYKIGEGSSAARPTGGRRTDYGFVGTMDTEIRRQRAEEVSYRIRDVWVDPREIVEEVATMTLEGVNTRVTKLTAVQEQDTQDIYAVIRDTQDRQTQIYQSVETLVDYSQYHYETARLLDQEALVSREAWERSIDVSYMTHHRRQGVIKELLAADHQRQVQLTKALNCGKDYNLDAKLSRGCMDPQKGPAQSEHQGRLLADWSYPASMALENGTKEKDHEAMIDEGVTAALAARDATRNGSGRGQKALACQVNFATCTLQGNALTWWNSHVKTTTPEAAHGMPWRTLKKMMTDKYCPRGEIKKLEFEMWNLKVKGINDFWYNL